MKPTRRWIMAIAVSGLGFLSSHARAASDVFQTQTLPDLPRSAEHGTIGAHGSTLLAIVPSDAGSPGGSAVVYRLAENDQAWRPADSLKEFDVPGTVVSTPDGVVLIGGRRDGASRDTVTLLAGEADALTNKPLPPLPVSGDHTPAAALGSTVYVLINDASGREGASRLLSLDLTAKAPQWRSGPELTGDPPVHAVMVSLQDKLYVFGTTSAGRIVAYRLDTKLPDLDAGWQAIAPPPAWTPGAAGVPFGHSHLYLFPGKDAHGAAHSPVLAYHTFTDTWVAIDHFADTETSEPLATTRNGQVVVIFGTRAMAVQPLPVPTNYGLIDHAVVALYLLGMVVIGWYFSRREKSTKDYFRGGQRVPWWASGMSLFATGASAISLMAMPGMSYATNWTYFGLSIAALIALPIALLVLVPLVRRLQIATANEYLERRFGLPTRLLGSVIYMFTQIAGRMASVMLLPAIALTAITGIDVVYCIIIMAVITTVYTYLGGLEAVIWADTIQGFVMIATVSGCLALALWKLGMPVGDMLDALQSRDKLHMFDFSTSLVYPTFWVFLVSTVIGTMGGIGDQNFVQRVQCTPDLRQARMAVATQLGVAVPINVLVFSLGTALWLFYHNRPELLNPVMKTDGIFPFFAAQQLPVGVSGLVVAALLAATMSTISSSICSVSDLGVNDFFRRFNANATDHAALVLGKILTALVGLMGMTAAIIMARSSMVSVWDLAILVTGLVSNGVVGLFMLGLLTRRAHQWGALLGVLFGMASVVFLRTQSDITFWLYGFVGSTVTFISGYLLSLAIPGRPREIDGLTVYTLNLAAAQKTTPAGTEREDPNKPLPA